MLTLLDREGHFQTTSQIHIRLLKGDSQKNIKKRVYSLEMSWNTPSFLIRIPDEIVRTVLLEKLLDLVPDPQKDHGADEGADDLAVPL